MNFGQKYFLKNLSQHGYDPEFEFSRKHPKHTFVLIISIGFFLLLLYLNHKELFEDSKNHEKIPKQCIPRKFDGNRMVCVCNSTYCDEFPQLGRIAHGEAAVYTTTVGGKRFEKSIVKFRQGKSTTLIQITIDTSKLYQTIFGFGGAFTDAAGVNWYRLSRGARQNLLEAYFGNKGIGYTVGRVPMAGCDFSTREYSYNDEKDDFNLTNFKLAIEDFKYKIPMIKSAQEHIGSKLKLFSSPWGPPGWMKTNEQMHGVGTLKGDVGGKYYQTWAKYFVRFFEEYAKNGITFWSLTVQNEPNIGTVKYAQLNLTTEMERDFIKLNLGPAIRKNPLTKHLKLMILDTSRKILHEYSTPILLNPDAYKFVDGIGIHWYDDFDIRQGAWKLDYMHKLFPEKFLFYTEACTGCCGLGVSIGSWDHGEQYMCNIIEDLNHYVTGWTDWNMCLDEHGGPNWVENFVDSPIVVNNTVDEFYKQPMYYALGHFSKFITPGSRRAKIGITGVEAIEGVVVVTPDKRNVLVLNNRDTKNNYTVLINDLKNYEKFELELESKSFTTVVWNNYN